MRRDRVALGPRQPARFVCQIEERLIDLSDVVKECDAFHAPVLVLREPGGFGEDERIPGDAAHVLPRLLVVRVDAWPDLHEVMLGIVSDTRDPAIADRKAAYRRRVGASGHSLNPLALISVPEYGKFSERDLESRTILASLIAAAR